MNKKIGKIMRIFLITTLVFMSSMVQATVTARVDRNHIVIGETLNLTITVDENTEEQPDLTDLQQVFKVLGTSQSSSTKIINGSYSVEKSWEIALMPLGIGKNTIPPIKLGNESTKPIQITITKSDPNAKANGDVFVEASVDKSSAYVKEQIILTVKLFYAIALSEGNLSEPTASSVIVTPLDKGASYTTNRNGKNYTVVEKHYALFAEKSGTLDLNPIIFNGRDNSSRRSFSMFSTGKPVRAISNPVSIEIKPIPQKSLGKDWLPASKVQLSQEWSKGPYKVGEPITRTIQLYVEGLSDTQVPDIDLGDIEDVRVYPEQPQTQTETTSQMLKTIKQEKIALIPTHAGAIRIPEYQLEWFNTKTGEVEIAKLPPLTLQVEAGEFALQKPDMPVMDSNKVSSSDAVKAIQNEQVSEKVKIVEQENGLWKIFAIVFSFLWVVTLLIYFKKKPKHQVNTQKLVPKKVSKKQIIDSINNKNLSQLQKEIISWWNQQYPGEDITNLGQIKGKVNSQMQKLLDELESQLYDKQKAHEFDVEKWLKQVKGNGLNKLKNIKKQSKKELPELY
jgi:hypothetical protein